MKICDTMDVMSFKYFKEYDYMTIGFRGRGFEPFDKTKKAFIKNCEKYHIHYIEPNGN